jgi:hypothetical protein
MNAWPASHLKGYSSAEEGRAQEKIAGRSYIFKLLKKKATLKVKIKMPRQNVGFIICPINPLAGLPNLVKLSL